MSDKGMICNAIMEAVRLKGTQSVVSDEAGIDGAILSKILSGESAIKIDVLEKIMAMTGSRITTEQEHEDHEALLRIFARRIIA